MAANVAEALRAFLAHVEPRDGVGDSPFKLACSLAAPVTDAEIVSAWPARELPTEIVEAWSVSRESRLFEDVDYGQWGLVLLSPAAAAERTAAERSERSDAYRPDDIVVGEFLGDQELLVLAPSEAGPGHVLVALPLDDRCDWHAVADDLAQFLCKYLDALGDKFWEPSTA